MKLLSKERFLPCTAGRPVFPGFVTYATTREDVLLHRSGWVDASDTYDDFADRVSLDNGQTWSEPVLVEKKHRLPGAPSASPRTPPSSTPTPTRSLPSAR